MPVKLTTWSGRNINGKISIGDYCLIAPGVTITSACSVKISHNCMLASQVIISDSDWHGTYNRVRPYKCHKEIRLDQNVWIGTRAIICKGVTIGENSIIGAGSVVTKDIPANVIAAGNPAKIVKNLNPKHRMITREYLFNPDVRLGKNKKNYNLNQHQLDEYIFAQNTFKNWLRVLYKPSRDD